MRHAASFGALVLAVVALAAYVADEVQRRNAAARCVRLQPVAMARCANAEDRQLCEGWVIEERCR